MIRLGDHVFEDTITRFVIHSHNILYIKARTTTKCQKGLQKKKKGKNGDVIRLVHQKASYGWLWGGEAPLSEIPREIMWITHCSYLIY